MSSPRGPPRGHKGPGPTFAAAAPRPQTHAQAAARPPAPVQPAQGPDADTQPSASPLPRFPGPQPPFQAPRPQFHPAVPPGTVFPGFSFVPPFADPQVILQLMQQGVQQQLAAQALQQQLAVQPGAYPQTPPQSTYMLPQQPVLASPPAAAAAAAAAPPPQAASTHASIDPRTNQPIRPSIAPASAAPPAAAPARAVPSASAAPDAAAPAGDAAAQLAGITPTNDALGMREAMMKHKAAKRKALLAPDAAAASAPTSAAAPLPSLASAAALSPQMAMHQLMGGSAGGALPLQQQAAAAPPQLASAPHAGLVDYASYMIPQQQQQQQQQGPLVPQAHAHGGYALPPGGGGMFFGGGGPAPLLPQAYAPLSHAPPTSLPGYMYQPQQQAAPAAGGGCSYYDPSSGASGGGLSHMSTHLFNMDAHSGSRSRSPPLDICNLFSMDARALTRQETPVAVTAADIDRRRLLDSLRKQRSNVYTIAELEQFLTPELQKSIDELKRRGAVPPGYVGGSYRLIRPDDSSDDGAPGGGLKYDAQPPDMRSQRRQGGGGDGGGRGGEDRSRGGGGGRVDFDRLMAEQRYNNALGRDQVGKSTDALDHIVKRIKGIVSRISRDTFSELSADLLGLPVTSEEVLEKIVDAIFDRALEDVLLQDMYADLCKLLGDKAIYWSEELVRVQYMDTEKGPAGMGWYFDASRIGQWQGPHATESAAKTEGYRQTNFKRLILNRCQQELMKDDHYKHLDADEVGDDEKELTELKAKRRMLANIAFIGQLYRIEGMLTPTIVHFCIGRLLNGGVLSDDVKPKEDEMEAFCKLMVLIGSKLESDEARANESDRRLGTVMQLTDRLSRHPLLATRVRLMMRDLLDLRHKRWQVCCAAAAVTPTGMMANTQALTHAARPPAPAAVGAMPFQQPAAAGNTLSSHEAMLAAARRIFAPVVFECTCCGDEASAGRPAASCSSCGGSLCPICSGRHAAGRGIFKAHSYTPANPGVDELTALGLHPTVQLCEDHPYEALSLACTTCVTRSSKHSRPTFICAHCVPRHSGHALAPIATVALESRGRVAQLLFESPAAAGDAVAVLAQASSNAPTDSSAEVAARGVARSIAARLASLPEFADAALSHVLSVRDAVVAAITERAALISDEIQAVVAAKEAAIRDELAVADTELSRVASVSAIVKRALGTDGFSDLDVIVHEESLADVVRGSVDVAKALQARAQTSARLVMQPVGEETGAGACPAPESATASDGLQAHVDAAVKAFGKLHV